MTKPAGYTFEFDTRAHDGAILRTPNKGGMARGVRFGAYAVASILAKGKSYRLNIYENRDGSIDVVVYANGRTIPENQLVGLRNVARSIYRDTFHTENGLRTAGEAIHKRHTGKPSGRVIETETGFGLEWVAPRPVITEELRRAFNYHRARRVGHYVAALRQPMSAQAALAQARADLAAGRKRFTSSPWIKSPGNGLRFASNERDKPALQWIEKPADMGLRFVGYCDKLDSHIGHTGWYADAFEDSTLRGVVYQLPGRDGLARFVAGHDNADNGAADEGGPACIDWSRLFVSDFEAEKRRALASIGKSYQTPDMQRPGYWAEAAHDSARIEAARGADEFARIEAEREKEYSCAWQAGQAYAQAMEERGEAKAELRALLVERRTLKAQAGAATVAICKAVESQARALLDAMEEHASKARKYAAGDNEAFSFWAGDKRLKEAFNEGAGAEILA